VSLAPITGKLMAELILYSETSLDIKPFTLARFK
jgi:glycine/D-amino acid oxidase-like deaminating enzyme